VKKNQARNRFIIHKLSDETCFIINPMGLDYDQDILIQVRKKTGCICQGKLLSGSI
jgi:hypothetical protein